MTKTLLIGLLAITLLQGTHAQEQKTLPASPSQVPEALRELVFGGRKQQKVAFTIGGKSFHGIENASGHPFLMWNADPKQPFALEKTRKAVQTWLDETSKDFGFLNFTPTYVRTRDWRGTETWEYEFRSGGLRLLGPELYVCWKGESFVGVFNPFPAPVAAVADLPAALANSPEHAWFADRNLPEDTNYRIVVASMKREKTATGTKTEVHGPRGLAYTLHEGSTESRGPQQAPTFSEYRVPAGSFPDQIWSDSTGLLWISQPNNNFITSFDPVTQAVKQRAVPVGRGPDGLWIDDQDRVWSGLYYTGHLCLYDPRSDTFNSYPAPYSPAALAIPSRGIGQNIWVTDHANNRCSLFDAKTKTWVQSYPMPLSNAWVVQGCFDPVRETAYFMGYRANALIVKEPNKAFGSISVPMAGGPSFGAYHDDKVYFSLWNADKLGEYDVVNKTFTFYQMQTAELGGPLSITPNGEAVVGTRRLGYISVLDPTNNTVSNYRIPTSTGLKDGLTVAPDGAIWFTGSFQNMFAKLVLK